MLLFSYHAASAVGKEIKMSDPQLNRTPGAPPLYHQLAVILKEKIESGEYTAGDTFPTEVQLQQGFQVSRITVRNAVAQLTNEGYLECARGIGTKVIFRKIDEQLKQVVSFSEEMKQHNIIMSTKLCWISTILATEQVASQLDIPKGGPVFKLIRVRCADQTPIVYSITYISGDRGLSPDPDQYRDSLYEYLNREHGILIVKGRDTFEAVLSDHTSAAMLEIAKGMPLIKRTRKTFDQYNKAIEFTVCYYAGDKYKYSIEL